MYNNFLSSSLLLWQEPVWYKQFKHLGRCGLFSLLVLCQGKKNFSQLGLPGSEISDLRGRGKLGAVSACKCKKCRTKDTSRILLLSKISLHKSHHRWEYVKALKIFLKITHWNIIGGTHFSENIQVEPEYGNNILEKINFRKHLFLILNIYLKFCVLWTTKYIGCWQ